jgi:replicative DNA helicase
MMRDPASLKTLASAESAARQPPHNLEAEQALLGAILLFPSVLDEVGDDLAPEHFHEGLHGRVYQTARELQLAGRSVTPVTLRPFFENELPIGSMPVPVYIARLAASATSALMAKDYARLIREYYDRRQLILIGEEMVAVAHEAVTDYTPQQQIEEAEARLFALAENKAASTHEWTTATGVASMVNMIAAAYQRDAKLAGLPTGFAQLDRDIGGLVDSDLIILAGRPSMGKSALAAGITFNVAEHLVREFQAGRGEPGEVSFYSLEMSAEQLLQRQTAAMTGIFANRMRQGDIDEGEFRKIVAAGEALSNVPVHIDTSGALSINQLTARARRRKRRFGTRLIVVDYLQLMGAERGRGDNRVQEVTQITTGLKALAKELGVPVIALSQLSRQVENREDKRPQLSDLRESGSIEQDADIVLFVYREEYYVQRREPSVEKATAHQEWEGELAACEGQAEVIRGKHRHGSTGRTILKFTGPLTKFSDWNGPIRSDSGE